MQKKKKGLFARFLDGVEKVGNKLPHPVTIFFLLCLLIIGVSAVLAAFDISLTYTKVDTKTSEIITVTDSVKSLLSAEGIRYILTSMVSNFTGFAPLGAVLVPMLGVGLAEHVGLISAMIKKLVLGTPKGLITAVVVFAGVMSNVAGDAGYIVLVPLGAIIFGSFGRNPIAGLAAAFAGVSGGFSANLILGTIDPLLSGISTEAAKIVDADYFVSPMSNYFFMAVSVVLIVVLGTIVTEKIVEPRLGKYEGKIDENESVTTITKDEKRGLRFALISFLAIVIVVLFMTVPTNGILRSEAGELITAGSPFMDSIVVIILLVFIVPGIAYGIGAKTIKNDKDVEKALSVSIKSMSGYVVMVFFAAQFVNYFNYSNIGTLIAVKGAELLQSLNFQGLPLLVCFILMCGFINLFMGSASAKWAIMAPIFIPIFMGIGLSPEATQVAFRIGDSVTNIITPLMTYFALIAVTLQKYDKKAGMGTLISTMVPYSVVFTIGWIILLVVWYLLGLPIGPGAPIFLG
ncbi:AbgT family transporter [uncultured Clostridium sp.]|uniref:AbgT family transporter n=1 Tax=uncultured Clostridium sp. TaxID=59620 RepID=UPI0025E980F2|nr:AbgT family transporter [uncultured Clostridium sp.]